MYDIADIWHKLIEGYVLFIYVLYVKIRWSGVLVFSLLICFGIRFHKHSINITNFTFTDEFFFYAFEINLIFALSKLYYVIFKDIIAFCLELYLLVFLSQYFITISLFKCCRSLYLRTVIWSLSLAVA